MLQVRGGNVAEVRLVQRLPVAAMNEDEQRTAPGGCGKEVQRLLGVQAIRKVLLYGMGATECGAGVLPSLEDVLEPGNSRPDVVLLVQFFLIEVSIH
ncbi:hypothetical protein D3C87_1654880 [compost metagenome]